MIRRVIIAVLALSALLVLVLAGVTAFAPQHWSRVSANDITYCNFRGSYAYFYALRDKHLATLPGPQPSRVWHIPYCLKLIRHGAPNDWRVMHLYLFPLPIAAALGIYPLVTFMREPLRRYRHRRVGRCERCGYDLTGNTTGTCPECGHPCVADTLPSDFQLQPTTEVNTKPCRTRP